MLGRLTGRGNTANIELVLKARPDVTIDYASVTRPYRSLADRVQAQTGIPYFLIDGVFTNTARAYRLLGDLLGKAGRAAALAAYADSALAEATAMLHKVPRAQRPRVYYGRRVDGVGGLNQRRGARASRGEERSRGRRGSRRDRAGFHGTDPDVGPGGRIDSGAALFSVHIQRSAVAER